MKKVTVPVIVGQLVVGSRSCGHTQQSCADQKTSESRAPAGEPRRLQSETGDGRP